jgi:hypothetical protein
MRSAPRSREQGDDMPSLHDHHHRGCIDKRVVKDQLNALSFGGDVEGV